MILEVEGNYFLRVDFGGAIIQLDPSFVSEVSVTQDIDRLLPTFRMAILDTSGGFGNAIPHDRSMNNVTVQMGKTFTSNMLNTMDFRVLRRRHHMDGMYEIEGILDVPKLVNSPTTSRSWSTQIKSVLESIAAEIEVPNTEISDSLDYVKTLIQPNWNTSKFLVWLSQNVVGKSGGGGYYGFIKSSVGLSTLVFRNISEFFDDPVRYKFMVSDLPFRDFHPVLKYRVFENGPLLKEYAAKTQDYSYFDFPTGVYTQKSLSIDDVPSLTEMFLVDGDDDTASDSIDSLGRSNDFTPDFDGRMKSSYHKRTSNMVHMWITSFGLENMVPGDIIQLVFQDNMRGDNVFVYQHSGFWMVKRVVQLFSGRSFQTNVLLTRGGVDTEIENTLHPATKIRRTG